MKLVIPILLVFAVSCSAQARQIVIACKKFTESYVLGEIAKRTLVKRWVRCRAQTRHGRNDHLVASLARRRNLALYGISRLY